MSIANVILHRTDDGAYHFKWDAHYWWTPEKIAEGPTVTTQLVRVAYCFRDDHHFFGNGEDALNFIEHELGWKLPMSREDILDLYFRQEASNEFIEDMEDVRFIQEYAARAMELYDQIKNRLFFRQHVRDAWQSVIEAATIEQFRDACRYLLNYANNTPPDGTHPTWSLLQILRPIKHLYGDYQGLSQEGIDGIFSRNMTRRIIHHFRDNYWNNEASWDSIMFDLRAYTRR